MRQATELLLSVALLSACTSGSSLNSRRAGTSGLWEFFLGQTPKVSESLLAKGRAYDMTKTSEVLPLHGESHVLALVPVDAGFRLRHPVAGYEGPWWRDVALAETSAATLALSNGLRLYRPGVCVASYTAALDARRSNTGVDLLGTLGWPLPREGGAADFGPDAFVIHSLRPLEGTTFPNIEQASSRCSEAEKSASFYGANLVPNACVLSTDAETGAVTAQRRARPEAIGAPQPEALSSEALLEKHTTAFCTLLAAAHARAWDDAHMRRVLLALKKNRNLKLRMARFAEEEAARLQTEWRAALKN